MARLILKYPDPRLRGNCSTVSSEEMDTSLQSWCQDLRDTMIANAGLGLAAPQIGIKKMIFAVDAKELDSIETFQQEPKDGVLYFVNPVLTLIEKETHGSLEGCLSVPGVVFKVKRSSLVDLTYTTPQNKTVTIKVSGENAVVIQHEYDHLLGKLFIDKLNPFDKNEFAKLHQPPKKQKSVEEISQLREQRRAQARSKRKK